MGKERTGLKVLVCGGRNYQNRKAVWDSLDSLNKETPIEEVISGGARGADTFAIEWAFRRAIPFIKESAQWDVYGKRAGMIRNLKMLAMKPDLVMAFPGGVGTRHTVTEAEKLGIEVLKRNTPAY